MQRYLVGGAVRDALLGLPVQDRDFVVVGAEPEELLALGYTPVGRDFPVFLHPETHEEHALARTERKTAPGYRGFVFHAAADVTLEEDLARRDLTINAMARTDDGEVIDPFGGQADLQRRLLRHVSPAFAEDPVRILRVARFSARFTDFTVAPETLMLMRAMVVSGEVDSLVPERVWQEFSRGLMEVRPSRMITVLRDCGALARLLPAVACLWPDAATDRPTVAAPACRGDATLASMDAAAAAHAALPVRLAILLQATAVLPDHLPAAAPADVDTGAIRDACSRMKIPVDCSDLAVMTGRERDAVRSGPRAPEPALALLERCDAFRKPARFGQMLEAIGFLDDAQGSGRGVFESWRRALAAGRAVDAGAIALLVQREHPGQPMRINQAVREGRISAIAAAMSA